MKKVERPCVLSKKVWQYVSVVSVLIFMASEIVMSCRNTLYDINSETQKGEIVCVCVKK